MYPLIANLRFSLSVCLSVGGVHLGEDADIRGGVIHGMSGPLNHEFATPSRLRHKVLRSSLTVMGRWPVNHPSLWYRRVPGSKPDSTEEQPCKRVWGTLNPSGPNVRPLVWYGSLERGVPAQVSSSSSDQGPKIALVLLQKRNVNVTEN
ncbi:hypothetical protein AVEN_212465-1 [Araneus ventricosus]|uniref:Uncharacterized protein n=1 Tax=Araneus ventricosus TaxID=182803 RepID=A0A4Y2W374_ARAVE|nr:hypothetical protein AVEN_52075-1 [Araneus ventricosus]GBO35193.1 hypothetical protein AVEN_164325-1 [Araneus ventricosus]GBO35196.1 hypothetical protein AVEN_212465-1 [Araneus ventricosus]